MLKLFSNMELKTEYFLLFIVKIERNIFKWKGFVRLKLTRNPSGNWTYEFDLLLKAVWKGRKLGVCTVYGRNRGMREKLNIRNKISKTGHYKKMWLQHICKRGIKYHGRGRKRSCTPKESQNASGRFMHEKLRLVLRSAQVTVADGSKAWTVFARSDAVIVGSNHT
jgi:hypothetical protein